MDSSSSDVPKLGSLAQAARSKKLNQARGILFVIGVLTVALNGFFFATVDSRIDAEVQKAKQQAGPGAVVDRAKVEEAKKLSYLVSAIYIALGVVFLALGILVKTFPVPATVLALVLYVGGTIADVALALSLGGGKGDEVLKALGSGIWIKILIVVGLIGAIQAALAYERERAKEASAEMEV